MTHSARHPRCPFGHRRLRASSRQLPRPCPKSRHLNLVRDVASPSSSSSRAPASRGSSTRQGTDPILDPASRQNASTSINSTQTLIAWTQDLLASLSATFDRWILDGAIVRGSAAAHGSPGSCLRFLQFGNLQAYAFLFGAGSVVADLLTSSFGKPLIDSQRMLLMLIFSILVPILAAAAILLGAPARQTALRAPAGSTCCSRSSPSSPTINAGGGYQEMFDMPDPAGVAPAIPRSASMASASLMLLLTAIVTVAALWVAPAVEGNERAVLRLASSSSRPAPRARSPRSISSSSTPSTSWRSSPPSCSSASGASGDRQAAAWKITIYLAVGSFILLLGLLGLYLSVPASITAPSISRVLQQHAPRMINPGSRKRHLPRSCSSASASSSPSSRSTPGRPRAYASAPTPAAMLHAGVLKKFGLYGLLRVALPLLPGRRAALRRTSCSSCWWGTSSTPASPPSARSAST